jgi:hypothetical protein
MHARTTLETFQIASSPANTIRPADCWAKILRTPALIALYVVCVKWCLTAGASWSRQTSSSPNAPSRAKPSSVSGMSEASARRAIALAFVRISWRLKQSTQRSTAARILRVTPG